MRTCKKPTVPKIVGVSPEQTGKTEDMRSFRLWEQEWVGNPSWIAARGWLWDDPDKLLKYQRHVELMTDYDPRLPLAADSPKVGCGVMSTLTPFKYGHFEAICQMPQGPFQWPGFWLWRNGEEKYTEIDIFEGYSGKMGSYGWPCRKLEGRLWYGPHTQPLHSIEPVRFPVGPFSRLKQTHRFSLLWTDRLIQWSFDSKAFFKISDPEIVTQFDQEMIVVFSAYIQEEHVKKRRKRDSFKIIHFRHKPL